MLKFERILETYLGVAPTVTMLLVGVLLIFTQGSALAPFIYSIFQSGPPEEHRTEARPGTGLESRLLLR